ncbi:MAG: DNA polymerase III subunit delta [Rikenellaceae bacterium]|nr:DNA polymerase III subunit delta [Rikenellaceae bacterium]
MAKSSVSFRDSIAKFTSIAKDIRGGKYAPVYLLMGEEGYFIDRLADLLATRVLTDEERAFNQITAYGKDSECGDIINFCKQMPMMGAYQVVILKEAQQLRGIDRLSLYTQAPSATTVLVICHKEKNIDKHSALYRHVSKIGVVFESVRPRDYEIGSWLADFVRSKGFGIEPKALTMLTDHLGADIAKISNELDKLTTYLPEGTPTITADHIEQNIGISKDFNNFELTRAISERNMKKALLIAEHFSRNPKDNPLLVTISTLFSHFQRIFIVNYQKWLARSRGTAMPADAELARMLKIPSAFFLNEYKQAATLYPNKKVFVILGMLREYDMKSKGMNSGSASEGELLRELLMKIFLL